WSWDQFLDGMITNSIFSNFSKKFERLPEDRKQAFLMSLPKSAYPLLLGSSAYVESKQYGFDTTFQDYKDVSLGKIQDVINSVSRSRILADLIDRGLLDWTYPSRWRRISRTDAASAIRDLDEVQIVIDDILSSEWENHGEQARFLNPKGGRKPTECMRLEPPLETIAREQGLERWIDPVTAQASEFWVVPMPGASDPIQGAATTDLPPLALTPIGPAGPTPPPAPDAGSEGEPAKDQPPAAAE
ncbi:MAG TPA: hypothetical protein VKQ54_12005, partial [Caulobacteraceae bacterium]|nr:hypothetical protein [Caulobacteraceae bacterium]